MLPKMSGIDVCRPIRARSTVPIIMVTAKGTEIDTVVGPRGGGRRLRDQALPPARAGRPHAGRAAPLGGRRAARTPVRGRRRRAAWSRWATCGSTPTATGSSCGARRSTCGARSSSCSSSCCRERRPGPHPRHPDRPGLGDRLRRRHQDPRRPHQAPPLPHRGRPLRARRHHDGPGGRLPLRGRP